MRRCWTGKYQTVLIVCKELPRDELHRDVRLSPNLFKVFIDDMIVAVEAAKQGVTVGGDTVSGLMFAYGFVGVPGTPENRRNN